MLSICRLVPLGHGRVDLQRMERYGEIDFPSAGPTQATDRQKKVLEQALKAVSLEDSATSSGVQVVLVSPAGRIVAFENTEQSGESKSFTWGDILLVLASEQASEPPTFMCEEQASGHNQMNPHCFEITDSRGRTWSVYQVRPGLINGSEFVEMGGIQTCQREDLADRLGLV